jgi:hypothetical protein
MNKTMNEGGFTMNGASFLSMGKAGMNLTDLVPSGYEGNQDLKDAEGTMGEFNIQTLTKLGATKDTYIWVRSFNVDEEVWNDDGHWTYNGTTVVKGDKNDALFKAGAGLWIAAPSYAEDDGAAYAVTDSGEVSTNDVKVTFNVGGFTAASNPYPVGIRLSSLIPVGYEGNQDLKDAEGTMGEFNIQTLTKLGATEATYMWVRSFNVDEEVWNDDGHWTVNGVTVVPNSDNDPVIPAGKGLWIAAPDWAEDDDAEYSITFKFPKE